MKEERIIFKMHLTDMYIVTLVHMGPRFLLGAPALPSTTSFHTYALPTSNMSLRAPGALLVEHEHQQSLCLKRNVLSLTIHVFAFHIQYPMKPAMSYTGSVDPLPWSKQTLQRSEKQRQCQERLRARCKVAAEAQRAVE